MNKAKKKNFTIITIIIFTLFSVSVVVNVIVILSFDACLWIEVSSPLVRF